MDYTELRCQLDNHEQNSEILVALLADIGFDSFNTENGEFVAWIPKDSFNLQSSSELLARFEWVIQFQFETIADQNWNAEWEKNFEWVDIDGRCLVRAPFHPIQQGFEYEIIIEPKMSFGTAHHETTRQMIQLLMDEDFQNKTVLDMGCGTGILAILADKKGSKEVWAIDNDEWAFLNSVENIQINNCQNVIVKQGDASLLPDCPDFDVVIANINRNILLNDIARYAAKMKPFSVIFFSGFYTHDLEAIQQEALDNGLIYDRHISLNQWVAARFCKK